MDHHHTTYADVEQDALASTAERLMQEFEGRLDVGVVSSIVCQANSDLGVQPPQARGELLERCARQRLIDELDQT